MTKKQAAITAIAIACASSAHANLIDLTPGGFDWQNTSPPIVKEWYQTIRPFQTLYNESLFTVTGLGTPTITLSWDLAHVGTFKYLFVIYRQGDSIFANFYQVTRHEWREGQATVTVNGSFPVTFFNAFGHRDVPDTGSTLILFGLSLLGLFYARH